MKTRSPVVAILGHVDHGKTTLLDTIRKSRIAPRESGGITQRIGAYEIKTGIKGYDTDTITFIDTPGHEAFSLLRARGAQVADIALLIIDAKDSVMPQTEESISHIKQADIPFIVVINKIDLPDANKQKVINDLLKYEVVVEERGGSVVVIPISAKNGTGVQELLEAILLISAEKKLTYDPQAPPEAYIIEAKKDKRGVVASIIMKNGCLSTGTTTVCGKIEFKVRSIINDWGKQVDSILPSTPAELLGIPVLPTVGDLVGVKNTTQIQTIKNPDEKPAFTLESILETPEKEKEKLSIILKTDSHGSLEALSNSLKLNKHINIILQGIGDVHKSDVFLAKTTKAIIIGFNCKVDAEVKDLAKQEKAIIKTYSIIYELLDELTEVASLVKEKEESEKHLKGEGKVLATFILDGGTVFGLKITKGKLNLGDSIQVIRGAHVLGTTKIVSLQTRAHKIDEVKKGNEAGMMISPPLDIRVGDVLKSVL